MEVWLVLLLCGVGVVCGGKDASYYYPPVYGHFKDADYAPSNTHKEASTKAGRYYYPPVYGTVGKWKYSSAKYYQDRREREREEKSPSYERRTTRDQKYQEDRREERKSYYKQQPEEQYKVREERAYVRPVETKRKTYYKQPETERRTYYKQPKSERRTYYKHPKSERRTYYKHPETERRTYYKQPETERKTHYRAPEKKSYPKKTQKCFQCEYSPPKQINYEVLVTEPYDIKVPRTVRECEWDRTIEYVYQAPKKGSRQVYGRYKEVPKYKKDCYPKTVFDTKTKYRSKYVKKQRIGNSGGFEACKGPLNTYTAKKAGVDDWDCHNNCYVKKDKSGTITRGCYSGQYKVDPKRLGCHYQGDNKHDLYCFCKGDHCNGSGVSAPEPSYSYDY